MFKKTKYQFYNFSAAITVGMILSKSAFASSGGTTSTTNNFSVIASNIVASTSNFPNLISALAYLLGIALAVLGIMKIKDHVENPSQTPLKDGAIRLLAGGALFALPMLMDAMTGTLNGSATATDPGLSSLTTLSI